MKNKKIILITFIFILIIATTFVILIRFKIADKVQNQVENNNSYLNEDLNIQFEYPKSWNVEEVSDCNSFPLQKNHTCLKIIKNDFEIQITILDKDDFSSSKKLITTTEYSRSKKLTIQNLNYIRDIYTNSAEGKDFINIMHFINAPATINNLEIIGEGESPVEINSKLYDFLYYLPFSFNQDTQDIPEIQEMDAILESIKFLPESQEKYFIFNDTRVTETQLNNCKELLENSIVGSWSCPINAEIPPQPKFLFNSDNTFKFISSEGDVIIDGEWEFLSENTRIKLKIKNDFYNWLEILKSDLSEYKSIKDYSHTEKYIEIQFNYFVNKDILFDKCEKDKFFIDLFNIFYYKDLTSEI